MNKLYRSGRFPVEPVLISARGVAPETPSMVQYVIGTGQLDSITARPTRAGFMKLQPMPPKNCFTTIIAKTHPTAAIQKGMVGGRL